MSSPLCPTCNKPFHKRRKRLIETGSYGKVGRPRKIKYSDVIKLKKEHPSMSYRQLAREVGGTIGMVQRALKEGGLL